MNDDWSTPTGEHLRDDFADDRTPAPDLLPRTEEADAHLLDAFFHELALDSSNDLAPNSADERQEDAALATWVERLTAGKSVGDSNQ